MIYKDAVVFVPTISSLDPHLLFLDTPLQLTLMAATLLLQPASFCLPSQPRVVPQIRRSLWPSSVSCCPRTGLGLFSYWSISFLYILRTNLLFVLCCKFLLPAVVCLLPFLWYFIIFFVIQNILKIFLFHRKAFNPLRIKFFTGWELGI